MSVQLFRKWQQKCICTCRVNLSFVLFIPRKKPQFEPLTPKSTAPLGSMSPPHTLNGTVGFTVPNNVIVNGTVGFNISYVTSHQSQRHRWVEVPLDLPDRESTSPQSWISPSHPSGPSERCRWVKLDSLYSLLSWILPILAKSTAPLGWPSSSRVHPLRQGQQHSWVGYQVHPSSPPKSTYRWVGSRSPPKSTAPAGWKSSGALLPKVTNSTFELDVTTPPSQRQHCGLGITLTCTTNPSQNVPTVWLIFLSAACLNLFFSTALLVMSSKSTQISLHPLSICFANLPFVIASKLICARVNTIT